MPTRLRTSPRSSRRSHAHPGDWPVSCSNCAAERLHTCGSCSKLITGASKLGAVTGFEYFAVPGISPPTSPPTMFDVFPGAPAVANQSTIVFKGNYTVAGSGKMKS